uniref:CBM20 domain-containing protein n=1 Tax=Echinococcus granulosus TaxID=6210 RepID=A0A068WPN9_ECHGR|nr:hypothetical protein EgrG_000059000 [Echinococcus granulosus]
MQKRDHNQTIPFSVLVDTKALEEICVYLCNADTSSSSRYFVGIVGSSPQFGNWNPIEGLRCRFEAQKAPGFAYFSVTIVCRRCDVWTCAVPKSKLLLNLQYRFYVAEWRIDIESDPVEKKLVVLAWESRLKPRVFDLAGSVVINLIVTL